MTQPAGGSAFDQLASITLGNPTLATQPRLVSGLAAAGATPQQAGTVNALANAAQAAQLVQNARVSGAKIRLNANQKTALDAAGVEYGDVEVNNHWSLGRIFHDVTHNPVTNIVGETANILNSGSVVLGDALGSSSSDAQRRADFDNQMRAAGYDPNNAFSKVAFVASGQAKTDLSDLYKNGNSDQIDLALKYVDGGDKFLQQYLGDPTLTDSQISERKAQLNDPSFMRLAGQVRGRSATIGNWAVSSVGWSAIPIVGSYIGTAVGNRGMEQPDSVGRMLLADTIDSTVAGFTDPTLVIGNGIKAYRMSSIALDGMGDYNKVRAVLDGTQQGAKAQQVRNGFQSVIDNARIIRKGSAEERAAAYARVKAQTPDLLNLLDDFHGHNQINGLGPALDEAGKPILRNGVEVLQPTFGKGDAIENLNQAADYFASKTGVMRLFAGHAQAELNYMPGQLSTFGAKKLIGAISAGHAVRSLARGNRIEAKFGDKAAQNIQRNALKANVEDYGRPRVDTSSSGRIDLRDESTAARMIPTPGDQVDAATGRVIDDTATKTETFDPSTEGGLLSAKRAEAQLASRGGVHFINRFRQTFQKFGSRLPTNYEISTSDPNAARTVMQYVRINGTAGDGYLAAAKYSAADEGTRKAMLTALKLQAMHAAGFGTNKAGREILTNTRRGLSEQQYSITGSSYIDQLTGEQRDTALFGGQTNEKISLTPYKTLVQKGAKLGVWQNTVGRMFNSQVVSNLMQLERFGWITSYASALRNSIEEQVAEGIRNGPRGVVGMYAAKHAAAEAGILPEGLLRKMTKKTRVGNAVYGPLHHLQSLYHHATIDLADEREGTKYILGLDDAEFGKIADDQMDYHMGSMLDPGGATDVAGIADAGMVPTEVKYGNIEGIDGPADMKRNGYGSYSSGRDAENFQQLWSGSQRYAAHLATITDRSVPQTRTILDHLTSDSSDKAVTLDDVVESLKKDRAWDKISRRSDTFRTEDGTDVPIVTKEDRDLADRQIAQAQVSEWRALLTNADGSINKKMVEKIRQDGKAPNADWIQKELPQEERPAAVIAPNWEAVPHADEEKGVMSKLLDLTGRGYKYVVELPLTRQASMPIFMANYGRSRYFMRSWEQDLVDGGLSAKEANKLATNFGMQMAATRTLKYIDNAAYRTQMDFVGRSFFAFQRATEAFIRRWGTELIEDPMRLRRLMLANEAANRSGFIYTDPQSGERNFTYPGSGFALTSMMDLGAFLHIPGFVKIPGLMPDLHSRVGFLNSGLNNPLQMGATPLVNIPMREIFKLFPSHRETFDQIDAKINGPLGQGQGVVAQIAPSWAKRFTDWASNDDKSTVTASAVKAAALNLDADGNYWSATDDPAEHANKLAALTAQTKNMMFIQLVTSFFAPAPPGTPGMETTGSKPDWFYGANGVKGLDSEYKQMVNDFGFSRANQVWAQLHPDKLFYQVPTSKSMTKNAVLQATAKTQGWIAQNVDYMRSYKDVGAYFVPQDTQGGKFDLNAYRAEVEVGLRQVKTTAEFANDVVTANASAAYYRNLDSVNALKDQYANNPTALSDISNQWQAWKANFYAMNPIFAQTQTDYATKAQTAQGQMQELRRMIDDPATPADVPIHGVAAMLRAYDHYHQVVDANPGNTNQAQAARADVGSQYAAWMQQRVGSDPRLAGVYAGVFRTLDDTVLNPFGA